jgi:CBS domain-containing protein
MDCPPETDLITVARMMAANRIHAVVVSGVERTDDGNERFAWSLLSDLDLVAAAQDGDATLEAGEVAGTEIVSVDPDDGLEHAAQLMVEHQLSHLLVVGRETRRPLGVISTLDIARALAVGEA